MAQIRARPRKTGSNPCDPSIRHPDSERITKHAREKPKEKLGYSLKTASDFPFSLVDWKRMQCINDAAAPARG
jgi:hypothetical protein